MGPVVFGDGSFLWPWGTKDSLAALALDLYNDVTSSF